ncbi:CBS domain-containing protein [Marinobacterium lutimaris]|uniref:CBS domain-containing protein n=1 Tax=Marinobacterium lutimaris TaxID=568106 RepID=A0A1H6BBZ4_9GAMM|nr:CBS domain-containing protein [Marinobacterium lutimaris]SEG57757.1 CBS domain-containing protein [Marinobacterium lutimaris]
MALVVYDQGYRIQTPVASQFKPKGVDTLTEPKESGSLPSSDDIAHDEARELEQSFLLGRQSGKQTPPRQASADNSAGGSPTLYSRSSLVGPERRKSGLSAKQLLTAPVYTTRLQDTLYSANQKMQERGIHHLVVIDSDSRPLGLISNTDLERVGKDSVQPVSTAYQSQMIVASMDTELSVLANTFVNYSVRALPVIDEQEKVVGIITRSDLLRLLINNGRVDSKV